MDADGKHASFQSPYWKDYDKRFKTKQTEFIPGDHVDFDSKKYKKGKSSHLTPFYHGPFVLYDFVEENSFKSRNCKTNKE